VPPKARLGGPEQPEAQPLFFFLECHLESAVQRFRNGPPLGWLVLCATRVSTHFIAQAPLGGRKGGYYQDMSRPRIGLLIASRAGYLVCPVCGCGQLQTRGLLLSRKAECDRCKCAFDNAIVETLKQIVALPKALGKHRCDCGHPEMRRLPDGVFHCPACRSEVLSISIPESGRIAARKSLAAFERIPGGAVREEGDRRTAGGGNEG